MNCFPGFIGGLLKNNALVRLSITYVDFYHQSNDSIL